jgi:hypothetical protein
MASHNFNLMFKNLKIHFTTDKFKMVSHNFFFNSKAFQNDSETKTI